MKRLLLFDIDGTLIDSGGAGVQALHRVFRQQFGRTDDFYGIEIAGRTDPGIVHQILRKAGVAPNEQRTKIFLEQYLKHLVDTLSVCRGRVLPGIDELLRRLQRNRQLVLGLLTGNMEGGARLKLEHYGLWQFFEFGAFADDHHDRNQLGHFARERARAKHGYEFDSAAIDVIGDTPHDIACGKAIGARTIAVATGRFAIDQLAANQPDVLLPDFSEVSALVAQLSW